MSVHLFFGTRDTGIARAVMGLVTPAGGLPPTLFLNQTHSRNVIVVDDAASVASFDGDAIVTMLRGQGLGIKTADCAPVLLYDETASVIAAIHSGWQGTLQDIVTPTVAAMRAKGADSRQICAVIGPCLQRGNFETGDEVRQEFVAANAAYWDFFTLLENKPGKFLFDNAGLITWQLAQNGVTQVESDTICTLALSQDYFSHRARHADPVHDTMRNVSVIWQD